MTRTLAAALLAVLLLAGSSPGHAIREGGTFRVGIPVGAIDSIDPILARSPATGILLARATCGGLMMLPDEPLPAGSRVVPEIAVDYPKVSNGRKTYTFTIRKGVRFSTGAPVTARSFAHTINRQLNPEVKAPHASDFADILGAQKVIDGKTDTASGVVARGGTLTIRLTQPAGDFPARVVDLCVVPETTPIDPEGVKAPVPAAGPYYIAEHVPDQRIVLARNRFYRGDRPRHVDRFVIDLRDDAARIIDRVDRGELDYGWVGNADYATRIGEFRRSYGVNKSRFFAVPANTLRMFALNASRPLFRNNPSLRQAVNFAVDRKALLRELGPLGGSLTDQYLTPGLPGFRNERIYPLGGPDVAKARRLARGRTRSGKAVLYTFNHPVWSAQAQIVRSNLKQIGLEVEIKEFPIPLHFQKLRTRGEPFDIAFVGWVFTTPDPSVLEAMFGGRTIGQPGNQNWSYFDSPRYSRLLELASRLPVGPGRYRTYGELDIDIARNAAPAIAYAFDNRLTLVSARTGCVVVNPDLDLAVVCLK